MCHGYVCDATATHDELQRLRVEAARLGEQIATQTTTCTAYAKETTDLKAEVKTAKDLGLKLFQKVSLLESAKADSDAELARVRDELARMRAERIALDSEIAALRAGPAPAPPVAAPVVADADPEAAMLAEYAMLLANNNHGPLYLIPLDNLVISPTALLDVACPRFVTLANRPAHEYTLVSGGDFGDAGVPYGGASHPTAAQTAPAEGTSVPPLQLSVPPTSTSTLLSGGLPLSGGANAQALAPPVGRPSTPRPPSSTPQQPITG